MGNLPKAASYLRAAWVLSQFAVAGDHLAQVYQKQGKRQEAEHLYTLALAVSNTSAAQKAEIRQHYKQLTGKPPSEQYSTRRLPDGTWSPTPSEELSRMRTVKIAKQPSYGFSSATFTLMLTPGKVESVEFVSGSEDLKPIAEKVKTAKFNLPVPDDLPVVRLARRGILTCGSMGCDFTLLLPQNALGNQYPSSY
jgi:hypothetical protein